ncbi:hypothetical protein SAMN02745751_02016 [Dethiosulfatibacter aminovorans DSM 17477]|uniref:RsgI N-terminal anti-sigma domain-containing protein n=1 Tax=Dethiosulfatibacter aminovorans DSM 17477 TaxID=1121476 RepID=A0A1M6HHA0_9FIRM|nr:hypothetical protein [Dethiosulfatibacter aminovorans]SHJ21499.1 hypothetical protein SAMN02745751_02016 [Dethiosulfatibacter aminovorans DSM 17477]
MKGVLIDKGKKHGTFLTGNGEFVKGKHKNRDIGEEFVIEKSMIDMKKAALVMVLVIALVGGYIPYNSMTSAYGYVEIDINPSVELGYNENMKVIKINALNDEGEDIIANIDLKLKGMQVDDAVEAIIAYAESQEYSTDDVVLTYTHSDEDDIDEAVEGILCGIDDGDGTVTCVEVEKEKYKEFRKQSEEEGENIPPAVYVLKEKIADLQIELDDDEKIEELTEGYDLENCKVSDLAHIKNAIKKEIQEEKKAEKENNQNQNSVGVENQEQEQEENGKGKENAPGQIKEKNDDDGDDGSIESSDDDSGDESEGENEDSSEGNGPGNSQGNNGNKGSNKGTGN